MGTSPDLRSFGAKMKRAAKALEDDINRYNENVAIQVQYEVAARTPVDVGTARSNWIVQLGSAVRAVRRAFAPYPSRWRPPYIGGGGIGEHRNLEASRRAARTAVAARRTDEPIYIVNNLPYIARLNDGHSKQAGVGFIQAGVQAGTATAKQRFNLTKFNRAMR